MAAQRGVRVVGLCPGARLGRVVRALLLLLWFAARGGALYFHIGETEKKCFIEEIPDETMVIGIRGQGESFQQDRGLGAGLREGHLLRAGSRRRRRALATADSAPPRVPLTGLALLASRKLPDAVV